MLRKLGLAAFLVGVVVPAAWLVVEHLRGRAQLADVLAGLKSKGATLDIERLAPPLPPTASNGLPALIAAVRGLSRAGNLLPPAIETVAPGRALPPSILERWPEPENTNSWPAVESWMEAHAQDYESLQQALEQPFRRAVLDYHLGFSKIIFSHLSPMKSAATALSLSAAVEAHRGEFEMALSDLAAIRVLETDLAREPILLSQLVRMAIVSIAQDRAWSVSYARPWTESQLAQLQATLPNSDYPAELIHGLEGERALCFAEIKDHSAEGLADLWLGLSSASNLGGGPPEFALPTTMSEAANLVSTLGRNFVDGLRRRVLIPLWGFGWKDQAAAYYLHCANQIIEAHRTAAQAQSIAKIQEFDLDAMIRPANTYARLHTILADLALPTLDKSLVRALRTQTDCRLLDADLAIRRYRMRHGQLPESLAALVPEFLPTVPLDGMDGHPLRYRRLGEEDYSVWSIGEDLQDQGGDGAWSKDESRAKWLSWRRAKDTVLPRPATAAQVATWKESQKKKDNDSLSHTMSPDLMKRYGLVPKDSTNAPAAK